MWFIRRMMRISWIEKKANELVLKETNLERSLIKTIGQRQLQLLGHICRHKGSEHLAITGKIEGKRSRGSQGITFIENLKSWAIGKGSNNNFIKLTESRFKWRNMFANVCSRQDLSDEFDDDMLEPELVAVSEPDKVEGESQGLTPGGDGNAPAPTPLPLNELAPPPSQEDLFGSPGETQAEKEQEKENGGCSVIREM
ncbi:endonuclease-reverse transcriptase [Plakobranchus ocellatus]|uniref:Endonuclease-reverse transcriptase n=1 Tax=Plakobranchus ocellatus TaxID=259542 RepID=A0AAV4DPR2_9GAST|nr:endonuclease-reverse transcriptase [Plakobranchus ocellatus]